MTIRYGDFGAYPGIFTELNPEEFPISSILSARGIALLPQKQYTQTYHTNPDSGTVSPTLIADLGVVSFGSTGHTYGSNTMQVMYEGAMVSWARENDQDLGRTLGWQGERNQSFEPNPLDRAMADAMYRLKNNVEWQGREGVYAVPTGASGTWSQRGYRYAPSITNVGAVGAGTGSGTLGTYGTLSEAIIQATLQTLWENKVNANDRLTLVCNSRAKTQISQIYKAQYEAGFRNATRNVAGVNILSIESDFGLVDILLTRTIPQDQLYILNMSQMRMVGHTTSTGQLFREEDLRPNGVSGSGKGIYVEMGLDHGPGQCHARIYGIGTAIVGGKTVSGT